MLEILSGFPLWLSLKSRVRSLDGRQIINYGLFGVQGRDNAKILQKQQHVLASGMSHMRKAIKKGYDSGSNQLFDNAAFIELMGRLLEWSAHCEFALVFKLSAILL